MGSKAFDRAFAAFGFEDDSPKNREQLRDALLAFLDGPLAEVGTYATAASIRTDEACSLIMALRARAKENTP